MRKHRKFFGVSVSTVVFTTREQQDEDTCTLLYKLSTDGTLPTTSVGQRNAEEHFGGFSE